MNIPLFKVYLAPEDKLMTRLRDVIYSGQISEGQPVYDFEKAFGDFIDQPNVLSHYSGTAALHTALILAGVKPGDDVISTAMTAEPTNMAIKHAGANIIWADVDPMNGNVTAESIDQNITSKTKAIMIVHYGGIPCDLTAIKAISEKHGVPVIEDAAHALGAKYDGQFIGHHSEYIIYSFQAIKHMTTVDGGMLICKNANDLSMGRKVRWFGIDRQAERTKVDVDVVGYKYHMNNVNATIGLVQLEHIKPVLEQHIANGKFFDEQLKGISGLDLCRWNEKAEPSYWFYTLMNNDCKGLSRYLTECGIINSKLHKRNDQHPIFSSSQKDLLGVTKFFDNMIHIPCGWWVGNEEREYIVDCLKKGW